MGHGWYWPFILAIHTDATIVNAIFVTYDASHMMRYGHLVVSFLSYVFAMVLAVKVVVFDRIYIYIRRTRFRCKRCYTSDILPEFSMSLCFALIRWR